METIISFNTFVPIYIQKNESLTRITTPLINANNEFKMDDALPPEEWRLLTKLWALNIQNIPPLPPRTNIISIKTQKKYPYNTVDISIDDHPYVVSDNPVENANYEIFKFIAYIFPVINAIPLYVFKDSHGIIFSLDSTKPNSTNYSSVEEHMISPIFLFQEDYKHFCTNGNIINPCNDINASNNFNESVVKVIENVNKHDPWSDTHQN